jgi:hypothetical protein
MYGWRYNSTILDLGTTQRWVANLTPQSLELQGENPQNPLGRNQDGSRTGLDAAMKKETELGFSGPPAHSLVTVENGKKVNLSLRLINWELCHEDIWGSGGVAPPFLTSALHGGERSTSRPGRFAYGERAPGTHWIGGWVGSRACLEAVEKRQILPLPSRERV